MRFYVVLDTLDTPLGVSGFNTYTATLDTPLGMSNAQYVRFIEIVPYYLTHCLACHVPNVY